MIDLASLLNPFRDNVVKDAWQTPADVVTIHDDVFRACLAGVASAEEAIPDSLLIYGSAGSGKTHLLTRVQRHLQATSREAPDSVLRCVFVFVRLQTSPLLLWQHVRRRLASDLMRRDQGVTQLQRLVAHQIGVRSGESPRAGVLRLRVLGHADQEALAHHLSEVAGHLDLPRDLTLVLEHLVCNRWVRDAFRWLGGEYLPEDILRQLGLGPDTAEDREQTARELVTALCRLAGETLPIVFCFDQVEALQRAPDDQEAFFRFGQMAADLHDADPNVFLITCLQSAVLDSFNSAVRQSDQDRMAKRRSVLQPLDRSQVEGLIRSRLDLVPELLQARQQRPVLSLFPFSLDLVDELVHSPPCVARRVLAVCARRFDELQHGAPRRHVTVANFLAEQLETRQKAGTNQLRPADTTRVFLKGVQVLSAVGQVRVLDRDPERADLLIEGEKQAAVSLRNEVDGRSLGPRLKTLLQHVPRADGKRLAIVRDSRLTISKAASKTREALAELQARGAVLVHPTVEALAALDALSSLLSDAKSGDLAQDGEPIDDGKVLDWLRNLREQPAVEPVRELLAAILESPGDAAETSEGQDLLDFLQREHLISLDEASRQLGHPVARLFELARASSDRILILEGPPTVLVDVAGIAAELEA